VKPFQHRPDMDYAPEDVVAAATLEELHLATWGRAMHGFVHRNPIPGFGETGDGAALRRSRPPHPQGLKVVACWLVSAEWSRHRPACMDLIASRRRCKVPVTPATSVGVRATFA
jgi:hypothetical protein